MLIKNINQADKNHVVMGNGDDVCILCAYEYAKENKVNLVQANRKLENTFLGKQMMKLPLNGIRCTICLDHIRKIAAAYPEEKIIVEENRE